MGRRRANGEGTVYEDKARGRWIGAVTIDGRRKKVIGQTKTEARRRLDSLRSAADRGVPIGDGNVTVGYVIDLWHSRALASRDMAPGTRETYEWSCRVLRTELGSKRVRSLSVDDVEAMLDKLSSGRRARPYTRQTLVKLRSVLGQALAFAERRGLALSNPARIAELSPSAARPKPRRSLTPDEAKAFHRALAGEWNGAMYAVMLTIGLRPGEAAGILWDNVDLGAGTLAVNHAVRVEANKAVVSPELKTSASRRTIALPEVVLAALRDHRIAQATERLASSSWDDERLVFATRVGTPLSPANVRRDLRRICAMAGLDPIRPNELRHTAASLLSDAGVPLEQIADVLGHENTRMLDQTYRHRIRPSITAAVATMDALLA